MAFNEQDHLITHANCLDGATCALVFCLFGGSKKNVHFCSPSHDKVDAMVFANRKTGSGKLYLADISISEAAAEKLDGRGDIELYDHHRSAIPLDKYDWCHVSINNTCCGSKLLYHYQSERETKPDLWPLVLAVDDRDRWINRNEHSADLSELFFLLGHDSFLERCLEHPQPHLNTSERIAVNYEKQRKANYVGRLNPEIKRIGPHKIGFVICHQFISEAGHELCEKYDLAACVLVSSTTVSMRAPENSPLDLSAVAKKYGGGGHRCAAGFQTGALIGKPLLEQVMEAFELP